MPQMFSRPSRVYVGIDPGASGALAAVSGGKPFVFLTADKSPADMLAAVLESVAGADAIAAVEKVGGFIGVPQPGAAMFKFGFNAGLWTMAVVAARLPFEEVTPQVWQKGLKIPSKSPKESKADWKRRLREVAQRLFPGEKVTLGNADALLIAEYARRKHTGTL